MPTEAGRTVQLSGPTCSECPAACGQRPGPGSEQLSVGLAVLSSQRQRGTGRAGAFQDRRPTLLVSAGFLWLPPSFPRRALQFEGHEMSPGVMFSTLPDEFLPWGNVYLAPGGGQGRRDPTPTEHPPPPPCAAGAGGVHEELRQEVSQRSGEVPVFERVNQSGVSQGMSGSLLMSRNLVFLPSRPAGCCCAAGIPADAMLSGSCPRAGALRAAGRPHGLGRRDTQATLTGFPPECEE